MYLLFSTLVHGERFQSKWARPGKQTLDFLPTGISGVVLVFLLRGGGGDGGGMCFTIPKTAWSGEPVVLVFQHQSLLD